MIKYVCILFSIIIMHYELITSVEKRNTYTETEQEFIERTRAITSQKIPQEYLQYLQKNACGTRNEIAYSPDNTTAGIVHNSFFDCPKLFIFNTQNHELLRKIELLDFKLCPRIAIARNTDIFATIRLKSLDPCQYMLSITNMKLSRTESYPIPRFDIETHSIIAFNKQGTHVIFYIPEKPNHYEIFPITVNGLDIDDY